MAYAFASASSQYLTTASAPVTNVPLTQCGWGYFGAAATQAFVVTQNTTNGNRQNLVVDTSSANSVALNSNSGLEFPAAFATGSVTADTWTHCAGSSGSTTSRAAYRDGGNKGTNTEAATLSNATTLAVGARNNGSSWGLFLNGRAAEIAVWDVVLTDAEIASLAKGFKPYRIRPQSLKFYAPLVRNLHDVKGALAITNNNTATVAAHPRVI